MILSSRLLHRNLVMWDPNCRLEISRLLFTRQHRPDLLFQMIYSIYVYIIKNSYYCNISLRNERKYIRRKWRSVKFISGLTNVRKDNRLNAFNNLYILVRCHWRAKTKYQQHFSLICGHVLSPKCIVRKINKFLKFYN